MNILWDFRLFSYGYGKRGVGEYTTSLASSFIEKEITGNLFIIGDKKCIPDIFHLKEINFIQYKSRNWKRDLIDIPLVVKKYKADILHYWIALGPLYNIGMGLFSPCKTVATIYDLGAENWNVPFLRSVKKSWYWRAQKKLIPYMDKVISISEATSTDLKKEFPSLNNKVQVIYKPIISNNEYSPYNKREQYFVTLGGSPHKNLSRVVKAFDLFRKRLPHYKLIISGQVNKQEEGLDSFYENIIFDENMENYKYYLMHAAGLIFCSIYEGLGLPPLDAMNYGCPLLVSSIPSLHETCRNAAVFVDPMDIETITDGMFKLTSNNEYWSLQSHKGSFEYESKVKDVGKDLNEVYHKLISSK